MSLPFNIDLSFPSYHTSAQSQKSPMTLRENYRPSFFTLSLITLKNEQNHENNLKTKSPWITQPKFIYSKKEKRSNVRYVRYFFTKNLLYIKALKKY